MILSDLELHSIFSSEAIPTSLVNHIKIFEKKGKRFFHVHDLTFDNQEDAVDMVHNYNIIFENVEFKKLDIHLGFIQSSRTTAEIEGSHIELTNCPLVNIVVQDSAGLTLIITDCTELKNLTIYGPVKKILITGQKQMNMSQIAFVGGIAENPVEFSIRPTRDTVFKLQTLDLMEVKMNLTIGRCHIQQLVSSSSLPCNYSFYPKNILNSVQISNVVGKVYFYDATIGSLIFAKGLGENNQISILESKVDYLVCQGEIKLLALLIGSCKIRHVVLTEAEVSSVEIRSSRIGTIQMDLNAVAFDKIIFLGNDAMPTHINNIILHDGIISSGLTLSKATIKFEKITVSSVSFLSIINQANIFFMNVSYSKQIEFDNQLEYDNSDFSLPTSKLSSLNEEVLKLYESDLGKLNFISCDFKQMTLDLRGSKINETFIAGTHLPERLSGDKQFAFYQLKKIFENQGDIVQSTYYSAKELESHYDNLKSKASYNNLTIKLSRELLTLWLNKLSNDFGTNWVKALFAIFIFSAVTFTLYAHALGYTFSGDLSRDHICNFLDVTKYIFEFVLPTHRSDFVTAPLKLESTFWSTCVDFVARIFNTYFIYQLVQAFRKYGKK